MSKALEAFRTISEVADDLDVPKHVLRFWEVKFPQIRPMKRGGGRRYYRPEDMVLLRGIQHLLHAEGYTIKGVQKILREQGIEQVKAHGMGQTPVVASKGRGEAAPQPMAAVPSGRVRALPKAIKAAVEPGLTAAHRKALEAAVAELMVCRAGLARTPSDKGAVKMGTSAAASRTSRAARSPR